MRRVLTLMLALAAVVALLALYGPRDPIEGSVVVDLEAMDAGVDAYLYARERSVPNLVRGTQKHVQWHDPVARAVTDWAVVYIHGFSASSMELRPVPKLVADGLEANLFYTRLTGHGQDGAALGRARVPDWIRDVNEALEIGRRIGRRTLVIATSTGGSLATLAAVDPRLRDKMDALVLVSPNFRVRATGSSLLTWPFARSFVPMLLGRERQWVPQNADHGQWWTNRYPSEAVVAMAAAAAAAAAQPVEEARVPALFLFADADRVVDARATRRVAARWGGEAALFPVQVDRGDDPESHVIAGDILSPGQTLPVAQRILDWMTAHRG